MMFNSSSQCSLIHRVFINIFKKLVSQYLIFLNLKWKRQIFKIKTSLSMFLLHLELMKLYCFLLILMIHLLFWILLKKFLSKKISTETGRLFYPWLLWSRWYSWMVTRRTIEAHFYRWNNFHTTIVSFKSFGALSCSSISNGNLRRVIFCRDPKCFNFWHTIKLQ